MSKVDTSGSAVDALTSARFQYSPDEGSGPSLSLVTTTADTEQDTAAQAAASRWVRVEHKFAQKSHVDEKSGSSKMKVYRHRGAGGGSRQNKRDGLLMFRFWAHL